MGGAELRKLTPSQLRGALNPVEEVIANRAPAKPVRHFRFIIKETERERRETDSTEVRETATEKIHGKKTKEKEYKDKTPRT